MLLYFILAFIFIAAILEIMRSNSLKLNKSEVICDNLPASFDGLKIFFASDMHYASARDEKDFAKIAKIASDFAPEIVLLGGDYGENFKNQNLALKSFSNIDSTYGTYFVLGNHDIRSSLFDAYNLGRDFFMTLLCNESVEICNGIDSIYLVGFDDFMIGDPDTHTSFDHIPKNSCEILFAHAPASIKKAEERGLLDNIKIALAGHTHGGQVSFFGLFSPYSERLLPGFSSWVKIGNTNTLYSNGVGQSFPIRLFARREAHFLTLRCPKS